jgi:hypothetical protein
VPVIISTLSHINSSIIARPTLRPLQPAVRQPVSRLPRNLNMQWPATRWRPKHAVFTGITGSDKSGNVAYTSDIQPGVCVPLVKGWIPLGYTTRRDALRRHKRRKNPIAKLRHCAKNGFLSLYLHPSAGDARRLGKSSCREQIVASCPLLQTEHAYPTVPLYKTGYHTVGRSQGRETARNVSMDARGIGVRFQSGARIFSSPQFKSSLCFIQGPFPIWRMTPTTHHQTVRTEIKNAWSCIYTSQYVYMTWCLIKYRNDVTFIHTLNYVQDRRYFYPLP